MHPRSRLHNSARQPPHFQPDDCVIVIFTPKKNIPLKSNEADYPQNSLMEFSARNYFKVSEFESFFKNNIPSKPLPSKVRHILFLQVKDYACFSLNKLKRTK